MQFHVIGRMIDAPVAPPQQELALPTATFEQFRSGANPSIKAVYPFADERATAFVVEVDSADELARLLGSLPGSRLSTFEAHPIASPDSVVAILSEWERALAGQ
jgi:muconolactone delta-isomerase